MAAIRSYLESPQSEWIVRGGHARWVEFVPREWVGVLCDAKGKGGDVFPVDVYCGIEVNPDQRRAWIRVEIGACADKELRRRVIQELVKSGNPFGFSLKREPKDQWTRVYRDRFFSWNEDEDIDSAEVQPKLREVLSAFKARVLHLPSAIRDVR